MARTVRRCKVCKTTFVPSKHHQKYCSDKCKTFHSFIPSTPTTSSPIPFSTPSPIPFSTSSTTPTSTPIPIPSPTSSHAPNVSSPTLPTYYCDPSDRHPNDPTLEEIARMCEEIRRNRPNRSSD